MSRTIAAASARHLQGRRRLADNVICMFAEDRPPIMNRRRRGRLPRSITRLAAYRAQSQATVRRNIEAGSVMLLDGGFDGDGERVLVTYVDGETCSVVPLDGPLLREDGRLSWIEGSVMAHQLLPVTSPGGAA